MRIAPSLFSQSKAFSLFELILLISILGFLLFLAMPRYQASETLCLYTLSAKLASANDALTKLYTQSFLASELPSNPRSILENLANPRDPDCRFELKGSKLLAHIGKKTLSFSVSPKDLSSKPKIYCSLSQPLCRSFQGRSLKK